MVPDWGWVARVRCWRWSSWATTFSWRTQVENIWFLMEQKWAMSNFKCSWWQYCSGLANNWDTCKLLRTGQISGPCLSGQSFHIVYFWLDQNSYIIKAKYITTCHLGATIFCVCFSIWEVSKLVSWWFFGTKVAMMSLWVGLC